MQEINANLVMQRIVKANIFVSRKLDKKCDVNVECKAEMKTSKEQENNSILLKLELRITTEDEKLQIELEADTIFELDQLPNDYDEIAEHKLVPSARDTLLKSLDEILITMGYYKMGLQEK